MRRFRTLFIVVFLHPFQFAFSGSEIADNGLGHAEVVENKLTGITPAVQSLIDKHLVSGVVVAIQHKGNVVYFEALGQRDIAFDLPMERDTIFRIYSMTKPITSTAIMILADEGKIDLDAPLSRYLKEFSSLRILGGVLDGSSLDTPVRNPTVRDLLRHTAGFGDGYSGNKFLDEQYRQYVVQPNGTLSSLTGNLSKLPLLYNPGNRWVYSLATDVLARLVETVSGVRFDNFLKERIFIPLEMSDTGFYVPTQKFSRFASLYTPIPGGGLKALNFSNDFRQEPSLFSGGGGLVSTAEDYLHFAEMLLNRGQYKDRQILSSAAVEMMTSNQLIGSAYPISINGEVMEGVGFGLGLSIIVEGTDLMPVGQYGWAGASGTHFWVLPKEELIVVVLSQLMPTSKRLVDEIRNVVCISILNNR